MRRRASVAAQPGLRVGYATALMNLGGKEDIRVRTALREAAAARGNDEAALSLSAGGGWAT